VTRRKPITTIEIPVAAPAVPGAPRIGDAVSYYDEGWRAGHIVSITTKKSNILSISTSKCTIRPIGPKGTVKRLFTVPLDEIKILNSAN
jgi:hypothetical protein